MLTITVSGPEASEGQPRERLAAARFTLADDQGHAARLGSDEQTTTRRTV